MSIGSASKNLAYGHCAFQKDVFSDVGTADRQRLVSGFRKVKVDSSSVSCRCFVHAHSLPDQSFIIFNMVSCLDLFSLLSARSGRVLKLQRLRQQLRLMVIMSIIS